MVRQAARSGADVRLLFPSRPKCILLTKPDRVELAHKVFSGSGVGVQTEGSKDSGVEIITTGARHLGAAVGTEEFKHGYVKKKVDAWVQCVKTLAAIASSEPHAAYSGLHTLSTESVELSVPHHAWDAESLSASRGRYSQGVSAYIAAPRSE